MELILWLIFAACAVVWLGVVVVGPPYVPTLKRDLEQLLAELALDERSHFVDLGSGDGRVLVAAARHGAKVSGVEINPFLVLISRVKLRTYKGSVHLGNMWDYTLPSDTTHVFVFGAGAFMNKLEQYFDREATHRSFVVMCYGFTLPKKPLLRTVGAFNLYQF